jgi:predicted ferric reductase
LWETQLKVAKRVVGEAFRILVYLGVAIAPLVLADDEYLELMEVTEAPLLAKMGVTSAVALLIMVALSVWRKKRRIGYEIWQWTHGVLAFVVVAALTHVLMVGYYVNEPLEIALWLWMSVVFVGLALWVRVVRPLELRGKAWRVEDVVPERGGIHTVVLEPSRPQILRFGCRWGTRGPRHRWTSII